MVGCGCMVSTIIVIIIKLMSADSYLKYAKLNLYAVYLH